jgi:O-antigen ligase
LLHMEVRVPRGGWALIYFVGAFLTAGWLVGALPVHAPRPAAAIGVGLVLLIVLASPRLTLGAIVILAILAPTFRIASIGSVDIRAWDPFYAGLLFWAAARPRPFATRWLHPLGVFVALAGLSVLWVAFVDRSEFSASYVSWLRLAQTISLAWLVPRFVHSERTVDAYLRLLISSSAAAVIAVVVFGVTNLSEAIAAGRYGYVFNVNTLGLVSAFLVMSYLWKPSRWWAERTAPALVGLIGLGLTKSVGSILALAVAVPVLIMWQNRGRLPLMKAGVILIVGASLALSAIRLARPEVLPSSSSFAAGSAAQRITFARAGLAIFSEHPVFGVGWTRSSDISVIGSPEILSALGGSAAVELAFNNPAVTPSVHNAYIQILAELGLVGGLVFAWALVSMVRIIRPLLASPTLSFVAASLVLVLVWWNDNPMYGGQTESMMLALLLGLCTAAIPLVRGRTETTIVRWELETTSLGQVRFD